MPDKFLRVALLGPESSGKTTLCIRLAGHYHTSWVPEFAREYISALDHPYTKEDVLHCAKNQIALEEQYEEMTQSILFYDTEMINFKVWMLDVYGECPNWIEKQISKDKYDFYLLTRPDLPFIDDPVRENPHRRQYFFEWYQSELDKRNYRYEIIGETEDDRFMHAVRAIDALIS